MGSLRGIGGLLLCLCVAGAAAAQMTSEIPLTQTEERDLVDQIERNWNLGSLMDSPDLAGVIVELRVELTPDGTVTKVEILNDRPGDAVFRQAAEGARRAVMISSPLQLPPGKAYPEMRFKFDLGELSD